MRALILFTAFTLSCSAVSAQTQSSAAYEINGTRGKVIYDADYIQSGVDAKPCTQARVKAYFNALPTRLSPSAVTKARQIAHSTFTRSLARPSTSASTRLSQLRRDVESEVKTSGIDFSQMPIEDAVMLMFGLMSEDADKDLKEMLEEMNEDRQKRDALREKVSDLRGYICRFIDQREKVSNEGRRPD